MCIRTPAKCRFLFSGKFAFCSKKKSPELPVPVLRGYRVRQNDEKLYMLLLRGIYYVIVNEIYLEFFYQRCRPVSLRCSYDFRLQQCACMFYSCSLRLRAAAVSHFKKSPLFKNCYALCFELCCYEVSVCTDLVHDELHVFFSCSCHLVVLYAVLDV